VKIKINIPLRNYKKNEIIDIQVDKDDIPQERYWRNRIRDAKIDNCVTIKKRKK